MNRRRLLALVFIAFLSPSAHAHQVIGISDGDTMTLLVDQKQVKIRLANIDAPEKKQPFGQRSKESLSAMCWGKDAQYEAQTIDKYKRTVALVYCDGAQVNKAQVTAGMAWVYLKYNKDRSLPAAQNEAEQAKRGLWADVAPVPPWEWRRK